MNTNNIIPMHKIGFPINIENIISDSDSVRVLYDVMEGLDYSELNRTYSTIGRNPALLPKTMFAIIVYGYMEGYEIAEKEGLSRFRIGLCEDAENFGIDVDRVIENIQEAMYETIGEAAECYLDDVTKEDALELEKRLNEVFYKWQEEHNYKPSFYKVISEEVIEVEK